MSEEIIKRITKAELMKRFGELKKDLKKLIDGVCGIEMAMEFDKYPPDKPTEAKPVLAQKAHIKAVSAKLDKKGLSDKAFLEMKEWARRAYGWRYMRESGGSKYPIKADLRLHLGKFTEEQLNELERILEG